MGERQNIRLRLLASVKYDAVNGDAHERSVCARQMREAADCIAALESERDELAAQIKYLVNGSVKMDKELAELRDDKKRIDYLQAWLSRKEFTGKCVLRESSTGRGFRLHEHETGCMSVREAIDVHMRQAAQEGKDGPV